MDTFAAEFLRFHRSHFVLWQGNDEDEEDRYYSVEGATPFFSEIEQLSRFAENRRLPLKSSVVHPVDLDDVDRWIQTGGDSNDGSLLSAWNAFLDFRDQAMTQWGPFQRLSRLHSDAHMQLSESVLREYVSVSEPTLAADVLKSKVVETLLSGLAAFDHTVAESLRFRAAWDQ